MEKENFLELYKDSKYEKPSVTVDAVILRLKDIETDNYRKLPSKKMQIFLNHRAFEPFKDKYALVGSFIDLNFELSDSMKKCVEKKVGLKDFYYEQLFTFGEKIRDPRDRVLSVSYLLATEGCYELSNGAWFSIDVKELGKSLEQKANGFVHKKNIQITLSSEDLVLNNEIEVIISKNGKEQEKHINILKTDLAFDHIKIIYFALERLKNKLEYTDIAFNFLPQKFTLTELKYCYEEILGEKLLDANFRRKISKMVEPTEDYQVGKGHRQSQYFTHNHLWDASNLD